jgi:5'-nucleotidase
LDAARYAVEGTPVDCVRIALAHLKSEIDWVISGVNDGGNLGADIYISGTVAAAREAALLGKSAVAVSRYRRRRGAIDWTQPASWTRNVLRRLLDQSPAQRAFWNVNLPDPETCDVEPEVVFCEVDPHALPVEFTGENGILRYGGVYANRRRAPGHDVDVCFAGQIAVSRLALFGASPPTA